MDILNAPKMTSIPSPTHDVPPLLLDIDENDIPSILHDIEDISLDMGNVHGGSPLVIPSESLTINNSTQK
jgi:hypothetical protein